MRLPEDLERKHVISELRREGIFPGGDGPLPVPASPAEIRPDVGELCPPGFSAHPVSPFPGHGVLHTDGNAAEPPPERPAWEVADIFRLHGEEHRERHTLTPRQRKVMSDIENCRTGEFGFHAEVCGECGHTEISYNSCHNRHCPKCQGIAKRRWVNARVGQLLPIPYYHVVFTLPNMIFPLCHYNQALIYDLLITCAAETLKAFGKDPKWLGAEIGFYGILHTWGQTLCTHLHIHFVVTGGGLNEHGEWVSPKCGGKFLFPVCALSKVFREKFVGGLKKAYYDGELTVPDERAELRKPEGFEKWLNSLVARRWVVYAKAPFAGPEEVVRYIGRYTHRVAISSHRIISVENGQVTFSYKDYKDGGRKREMTLTADEFIRRFLLHVLPSGFHRIRHYGILANGRAAKNTEMIREMLRSEDGTGDGTPAPEPGDEFTKTCPVCGGGKMICVLIVHPYYRISRTHLLPPHLTGGEAYEDTS
ncbi:IS91 family transposase [Desulfonema magnum]|uniref:Transposase zinc-binding domain containing-protein n=1 Tax=Desulfonema magnum TaxID=45655 RepID=A0A975BSN7_9BACT|nr:IS91 family transposase [Desulfonema magnum]QTA90906.1 Transposase zinc-binding domain containing-protein [Desulfonema magnum]